jgi:hypothetical protein
MFSAANTITDDLRFQTILQQKDQRIVALEGELFTLKEQLAWLKKQIFGAKSERIVADLDTQPLLPDVDLGCPVPAQEPEQETISYDRNKRPKNRGSDNHLDRCREETQYCGSVNPGMINKALKGVSS